MNTIDMQGLMLEITIRRRRAADWAVFLARMVSLMLAMMLLALWLRVDRLQAESEESLNRAEAILAEVRAGLDRIEGVTP